MRPDTRGPDEAGLRREDAISRLVSVVIPAYNAGAWIASTLASVRAQTYEAIEVVVADDGSSDDTVVIAESLGARMVHVSAGGPGGARNAGVSAARGAFIQFLDADDVLAPGKIARQVSLLASSNADVAWEPFHHLVPAAGPASTFEIGRRVIPDLGPDLPASLLMAGGFIQLGAILVRRSPTTDAVRFAAGRDVVEDVRYLVELAMRGATFVSADSGELGLLYRQHAGPRHSTRSTTSFAKGCAANAAWAESEWERHGGLSDARRIALGEAYAFAARQLAAADEGAFQAVAQRGLAHGDAFLRHLPPRVRWLARVIGYRRAESIAVTWRRARRQVTPTEPMERR